MTSPEVRAMFEASVADLASRSQPVSEAAREAEPSAEASFDRGVFLAFKGGFMAGFAASGEGWNGEYPSAERMAEWLREESTRFAQEQLDALCGAGPTGQRAAGSGRDK